MSLIFRNRVLFFVNVSGFEKRVFFEDISLKKGYFLVLQASVFEKKGGVFSSVNISDIYDHTSPLLHASGRTGGFPHPSYPLCLASGRHTSTRHGLDAIPLPVTVWTPYLDPSSPQSTFTSSTQALTQL